MKGKMFLMYFYRLGNDMLHGCGIFECLGSNLFCRVTFVLHVRVLYMGIWHDRVVCMFWVIIDVHGRSFSHGLVTRLCEYLQSFTVRSTQPQPFTRLGEKTMWPLFVEFFFYLFIFVSIWSLIDVGLI